MTLSKPGANSSPAEITSITAVGFWLLIDDRKDIPAECLYFVPFTDYPAFLRATVEQIVRVEQPGPGQFHWPDLDIDIELAALEQPERFPLVYTSS